MPLARKLRTPKKKKKKKQKKKKKKTSQAFIILRVSGRADHYDGKLQSYLTLPRACFYKLKLSRKV